MAVTKIMIVEDERIVAKDLRTTIEAMGYAVSAVASSGREAIKKAEESLPDLVLMDIVLKGDMDGVTVAREIRDRFDIPVVYLTAYADTSTLQRAKATEPFGYILKPFEERELTITLMMALYKHKMEQELKDKEKRLRESEEKYRTIFETTGNATLIIEDDMTISLVNREFEKLSGYSKEEVEGKRKWTELVAGDDLEKMKEYHRLRRINPEAVPNSYEFRCTDRQGNLRDVFVTVGLVSGTGKSVASFSDVTEHNRLREELLKAHRLESLGIFAGGIAHDFNNLLTGILGNISLAKTFVNPQHGSIEILTKAEKASLRAKDLTYKLLTFAQEGEPLRKTISIAELIKDSIGFALSGSNVRAHFSLADDLWPVRVDEGQMSQVIHNLAINAREAMPEGGRITIRAENAPTSTGDGLPLKAGDYIEISVEDQGVGIPKENLQKIFDPYFTTKQRGNKKGTGLGLAICYSIVKMHEGLITVESEMERGTTFHVYLPASRNDVPTGRGRKAPFLCGAGRILVVDDEEVVRDVAMGILSHMGYSFELASDGNEAIERFREARLSGQPFDAVIMDLTIPGGMGGKEALSRLLEIDPNLKAIASSGYSHDTVMADFRKYGFKGILNKPYSIEEFSQVLHSVLMGERS